MFPLLMSYCALLLISLFLLQILTSQSKLSKFEDKSYPWNFPLVPAKLPSDDALRSMMYSNSNGKLIPRHLWMAFKEVPEPKDRKEYLNRMFQKNTDKNWTLHLEDNKGKLEFMQKYFNGTSLLWAYTVIHAQVGNSAADIWRYGVLWLFGGLYMDDDSYFEASFDELIGVNDTLVMAAEKNAYHDDCFLPHHHLSARSMHRRFNRSVSHLFGGRTLVSWGIFAAPRHPIIMRTMANIVELIKHEYLHRSVVNLYRYDVRWKICMCTTGPPVLTASAREVILEKGEKNVNFKVCKRDFQDYGGVFKMPDFDTKGVHYMHTMQKFNIPLLGEYADFEDEDLEDRVISHDGKELFLVSNGTRKSFADFDAFTAFRFNLRHVLHLSKQRVELIPHSNYTLTVTDADSYQPSTRKIDPPPT